MIKKNIRNNKIKHSAIEIMDKQPYKNIEREIRLDNNIYPHFVRPFVNAHIRAGSENASSNSKMSHAHIFS